jgi:hypothetical protein
MGRCPADAEVNAARPSDDVGRGRFDDFAQPRVGVELDFDARGVDLDRGHPADPPAVQDDRSADPEADRLTGRVLDVEIAFVPARPDDQADHDQHEEEPEDRAADAQDPGLAFLPRLAGAVGRKWVIEVGGGEAPDRGAERIPVEGDREDPLGGADRGA